MASAHDETEFHPSSTLPRRQLGRFLREWRDANGFTLAAAAKLVDLSTSALQRVEAGQTQKVRKQDVRALCEVYGVGPADTAAAIDLAALARTQGWYHAYGGLYSDAFNMYVGLEAAAHRLTTYHEHVPGLLQTADYARAVIGAYPGFTSASDVDRRIEHRMKRQAIVTRKTNPVVLEVLLHESALHRMVGGRQVMAAQLRHLAEVSKRPNVAMRLYPFSAGLPWGLPHGSFTILAFDDHGTDAPIEPPLVFIEGGPTQDVYLEKPDDVRIYSRYAAAIRSAALDEDTTREYIRRVTKEFEYDQT
ncbi:helix-turn-helix domain-containing protein [Nocardia otitidiscaviarum]|uniref:Helix-turn-helix domain-containing protein n=1 Tax=Nocardia otitidiscaviarum TaxID=1823 RepID=A0A516NFC1_9NOCA|nr:helix-turn-helix transcriptional regulator [Nocardia otitidiscaviarum]MCP9622918.1 helix-turn-helix domain-containing protein [Nocardia otitidiscaviarum]QDP77602.1 helix-turn-helix domain-containing protein [Nocardia otitidiscaviarum]